MMNLVRMFIHQHYLLSEIKIKILYKKQLSPDMQNVLWNLCHSASDHMPGKLFLCIGLPVMIQNNDATELCITKGQEGHVVGWKSGVGSRGQVVLDTLFVKLYHPAKNITILTQPPAQPLDSTSLLYHQSHLNTEFFH